MGEMVVEMWRIMLRCVFVLGMLMLYGVAAVWDYLSRSNELGGLVVGC